MTKTRLVALALAFSIPWLAQAQEPKKPAPAAESKEAPSGHYLLTLDLGAQKPRINLEIEGKNVRAVKSSDPSFEGMTGQILSFRSQGNVIPSVESGAFMVRMRNEKHAISQIWIFRKDGSAAVREIPDRGEMQTAVKVDGDTIEPAK